MLQWDRTWKPLSQEFNIGLGQCAHLGADAIFQRKSMAFPMKRSARTRMTAFLVDRLTPGRCRNKLLYSPRSPSVFELTAHFAARDVGLAAMRAAMRVACAVSYMSLPSFRRFLLPLSLYLTHAKPWISSSGV